MYEAREKRDIWTTMTIVMAAMIGLSVVVSLLQQCSGTGSQYFGKWKKRGEVVTIEDRPGKKVPETHDLADGQTAKLIRPIRVRGRGDNLHLMIREGLYNIDGNHAIIALCDICRIYVIFAVKRDGDNLLVGVPKGGYSGIVNGMWHTHYQKLKYDPKKWITYKPKETQ
jgi:hypothetical protein